LAHNKSKLHKKVLITGASGLLGQALVNQFNSQGVFVFAQYHKHLPENEGQGCEWIWADFSTGDGINNFLIENSLKFKSCDFLVNNYGPITYKKIENLSTEDFFYDFYHNVIATFQITNFFIKHTQVKSVVNIGFKGIGEFKPYKNILPYALAKNGLLLLTQSLAAKYRHIHFNMVSPATLQGAKVKLKDTEVESPQSVANKIYELITKK
jgi:3-oxoacyl-[acyl-carrier protein] reductase